MGEPEVCEVCGQPIVKGDHYVTHPRLGVYIHATCPKDNVRGEDVSTHTMLWSVKD